MLANSTSKTIDQKRNGNSLWSRSRIESCLNSFLCYLNRITVIENKEPYNMALRPEPSGGPQAIAGLPTYWQDASKNPTLEWENSEIYLKWH